MDTTTTNSLFRRTFKSLLIGSSLLFVQSMPLCAKNISLSSQLVQPAPESAAIISNASLLGGAYFMVLLVIGYVLKWYFDLRKSNSENAE